MAIYDFNVEFGKAQTNMNLGDRRRIAIAAHVEVQAGREDVLAAGGLIVRGVLDVLRYDRMIVSEADGLDGLVELAGQA